MKQFKNVLGFELSNYFKNKSYLVTTILITVVLTVGLFVPTIMDTFKGEDSKQENINPEKLDTLAIYDEAGVLKDLTYLTTTYPDYNWKMANSEQEVRDMITDEKAVGGYVVKTPTEFTYVVHNSSMYDSKLEIFTDALGYYYRTNYMKEHGIDAAAMEDVINTTIQSEQEILGKDSVSNYLYTYILIMVIYMIIILYGQLIATSVTAEKSNRAIEVLITSSKPNALIFGKVFAGVIASVFQVGIALGAGLISYRINQKAWDGMLDFIFNIPVEVLITFFLFLIIGFLFYSFLYASLGALVSKTEDVSKAIGPVLFIFLIGFFIAMFGIEKPDSLMMKVTSFIPFTSVYTMIIRVAMGTVNVIEIVISLLILGGSAVLTGVFGAKIYRMGTLHYGNPLKLSTVLKRIAKNKE